MESELREGYKMTELGALPEEWAVARLNDCVDIRLSNVDKKISKNELPVILCNYLEVYKNEYITSSMPFMVGSAKSVEIQKFRTFKDDVIITKDSEVSNDIAQPVYVAEEIDDLICGYHLALLRPQNELSGLFLSKALQLNEVNIFFQQRATGTTRFGISKNTIETALIPLPPLPEQRRIATILSTLDETVEHTEALIEKYKNIKAGLMSDLLTRGIDEEGRIRSEGTHRFNDSVVGRVPEEWEVGTLSDIAQIEMGQSPNGDTYNSVGDGRPLLNGPAEFGVNHPSPVQWTSKPTKTCNSKDILFCVRGSTTGRMNVADQEYCIGRGIAAISGISNIGDTFYIKYILKHKIQYIFSLASGGGSTFPNITSKDLSNLRFTYPPLPEQRRIAEILTAADQRIEKEEAYRDKLLQLKKGLMQDLLTGKVRVKAMEVEA
jgi:type I restriction enzyme S subunit